MPRREGLPLFDKHEDLNNEEFVSANEHKFIPIDEVSGKIKFADRVDKEFKTEEDKPEEVLEQVRHDINNYSYKHRGSEDAAMMESFHIDHDTNSFMTVTGDGPIKTDKKLMVEENYLIGETPRKGVNRQFVFGVDKYHDKVNTPKENLKTEPDNKKERRHRGLLRSIFHDIWTRN